MKETLTDAEKKALYGFVSITPEDIKMLEDPNTTNDQMDEFIGRLFSDHAYEEDIDD